MSWRISTNSGIRQFCSTWSKGYQSHVFAARHFLRQVSSSSRSGQVAAQEDTHKTRNIGIIAHIDAGKTTTTERMLFYSGFSRHLGDVDDGDTVMDYMEQERNRGITITSAAITFYWNKHRINLIDTPGHVDFTVEVERCLRVLDGAVAVLDASAGVEAQTLTVWKQASSYNIPCIIYINKMDKFRADFSASMESVQDKLHVVPLAVQLPLGAEKNFTGIVDIVNMTRTIWPQGGSGIKYEEKKIEESTDPELWEVATNARSTLVEQLADLDDAIGELVLNDVNFLDISANQLQAALRRVTISQAAVPVICGSSLKNKGVQPLLDAIMSFLPAPSERHHDFVEYYKNHLCALVFKIIHDKQRGALTYLRLYSGGLKAGNSVYNVNRDHNEKVGKLYQVFADEYKEVKHVEAGNIVVATGINESISGDTLTHSASSARSALRAYAKHHPDNEEDVEDDDDEDMKPVLATLMVPDPVFFCSIEAPSQAYQQALDHALRCLQREDPSLHVHTDPDTGQLILSGMGELHLEIIRDRILKEYKVETYLGPLQISYKESSLDAVTEHTVLEKTLGNTNHRASMTLSIRPSPGCGPLKQVDVAVGKDGAPYRVKRHHLKAVTAGVKAGLNHGPLLGFPVLDVEVELMDLSVKYGTSLAMVSACASQCLHKALTTAGSVLLEPMMNVQVLTSDDYQHVVLSDLSQRRAQIRNIQALQDERTIETLVPLSELLGYATALRTITSGTATFHMELSHYETLNPHQQAKAIERVTGFAPV